MICGIIGYPLQNQLIPARGRKLAAGFNFAGVNGNHHIPARGRNLNHLGVCTGVRWNQLIPARGRKPYNLLWDKFYIRESTHPREGTVTLFPVMCVTLYLQNQLIPARGRQQNHRVPLVLEQIESTHPREGTVTQNTFRLRQLRFRINSSPQGDGNLINPCKFPVSFTRINSSPQGDVKQKEGTACKPIHCLPAGAA